ncbi:hypothetical protein NDU88_003837 [Pleurodeles waltl]|uniref:Secreted protein n=1 Tax=Pleurodeles waltl TaxID=8319 RepID=A0AAV7VGY7_PLEWA|nr:hypothetical protein NDU88_003837 [Pleurodeles waltl]
MAVLPLLFSYFSSSMLLLLSSSDWSAGSTHYQRRIQAGSGGPRYRRAPSSPQARAVRSIRSPALRHRLRPADATSGFFGIEGLFSAGRAPARKSPASRGGSGRRLRSLRLPRDLPVGARSGLRGSPVPSQAPPRCDCGMPQG